MEQVRDAAKRIKEKTAFGVDDLHPRLWASFSDELLELMIEVCTAIERHGTVPRQARRNLVCLIPKAAGGVRPIALLASFLRVWARVRRPIARQWEKEHDRECFQNNCVDALFDQALHDEAAFWTQSVSVSVLLDIVKCFEHVSHAAVVRAAVKHGFPLDLVRLALAGVFLPAASHYGRAGSPSA